jgi:hypothetical protein
MIDWNEDKEARLSELARDEARYSESRIASIMSSEFGEAMSRDAIHNKMRRIGVNFSVIQKQPKILLFDIETAPNVVYTWGLFNQDIALNQIASPEFMICWAAKWLFDDRMMNDCISPTDAIKGNDESITISLWDVINEADIIVAHNGITFDIPWANSRFIHYGMMPPSPYKVVDTYRVCRQQFRFVSNKLAWVSKYLTKEEKIKTDFDLWANCMKGDQEALDKMSKYNIRDTALLEDVYVKLRPWIRNHPNLGLYYDSNEERCCHCGSINVVATTSIYATNANIYQTYRCDDCGAINRVKKASGTTPLRVLA